MHKITKGLKKKKKGKKSKHKDEELFKPEELEKYRKEHQAAETSEGQPPPGQNQEEWRKFLALTSGVDDILKKTQGDLDRIKSTSFFQRVPPPSEVKKQEEEAAAAAAPPPESSQEQKVEEFTPQDLGIVPVSESESESDDEDDIFDTAYIDAIAAGEVKLAYIPESPTETEKDGDDPFDTSIAERAILGPAVERKGKKLVPIGAAVEVLTGRVTIPTCAVARPAASSRRQILKERDLLLGSFDDNANSIAQPAAPVEIVKTLLDDDAPPLDEPIDLSKNLQQFAPTPTVETVLPPAPPQEDEDDEEFALLAAESLTKAPQTVAELPLVTPTAQVVVEDTDWAAFDQQTTVAEEIEEEPVDPFDTTFAENILPGKAELKLIENEILVQEDQTKEFKKRTEEKLQEIIQKVSINVTDPAGQRESISSLDRVSETDLNLITPIHRDLLGGSNTDLSNLGDLPLRPTEQPDDNYIEYCDPFDTSIVESTKLPGQTELKFIEKELLGDIKPTTQLVDDDFDPRAGEPKERTLSRPDILNIQSTKTVSFDLPSPTNEFLNECGKSVKPLTPFYVRKSSLPGDHIELHKEDEIPEEDEDPFDTSFASDIKPGKTELKLIEREIFDPQTERNLSISDQDFDPRNEDKVKIEQVVQNIKDIALNKVVVPKPSEAKPEPIKLDLLAGDFDANSVAVKVLTPAIEKSIGDFDGVNDYSDPFDTSIAVNIYPGKTELKLLESELFRKEDEDLDDFNPRAFNQPAIDLLEDTGTEIPILQPLNPTSFDIEDSAAAADQDIDPFDTSIANNIVPGRTELKLLESELM